MEVFVNVIDSQKFKFTVDENQTPQRIIQQVRYQYVKSNNITELDNIKITSFKKFRNCYMIEVLNLKSVQLNSNKMIIEPFFDTYIDDLFSKPYFPDLEDQALFQGDFQILFSQLNKLLIHVLNNKSAQLIRPAFLLYYQKFISPAQLLDKLFYFFSISLPSQQPLGLENYTEIYVIKVIIPLKLSVMSFLEDWLKFYFDDFTQEMISLTTNFINKITLKVLKTNIESIQSILNTNCSYNLQIKDFSINIQQEQPFRIFPGVISLYLGGRVQPKILHQNSINFESQKIKSTNLPFFLLNKSSIPSPLIDQPTTVLTSTFYIFLFEIYTILHPRDFLQNTPIIQTFITRFNTISSFISEYILKSEDFIPIVENLIKSAEILLIASLFEPAIAILTSIQNTPISRIVGSFPQVEQLLLQFGIDENWRKYRQTLNSLNSQECCFPLLSIARKDIFISEEGAEKFEKGRANVGLCLSVYNAIHRYLRFQFQPFPSGKFEILFDEKCYNELLGYQVLTDDQLWEMSYARVPRGG